jgi:hypothetical protein
MVLPPGGFHGRMLADLFNPRRAACDTFTDAAGRDAGGLATGYMSSGTGERQ